MYFHLRLRPSLAAPRSLAPRSTTAEREEPTTTDEATGSKRQATSNATVVPTKPNQQDEKHGFACCNQQGELPPVVFCLAMMRGIVMKQW